DGPARHDHRHDAGVQGDRRLGPGGADAGDVGRRAGADSDRVGPADRVVRALRLQLFRAHPIASARPDGASWIAPGGPYPPRPGRRRDRGRGFGHSAHAERGKDKAMKLRKGRGYRRGRIEIIPMIDVMFFLLVTFMLASLSMQSLNSI